ncbi:hypothetical protein PVAP13_4NG284952 [Panicum virgatum]|uniref:Secreted protein n=1 Tax=Panicum virgatum TaxID=38727 RepID=A0A8T0T9R7_PANVG|nr:hypothetical protein PVAP13_4NG284952 [Panicum virgatum]KAG2608201.1 hypothetical protein PVAP13_4NG284952 [Panicum virgatum]
MIYPMLSILVTIPTLGSAHSLRKVNWRLSIHCSWTAGSQSQDLANSFIPPTQIHMEMTLLPSLMLLHWHWGWNQTHGSQIRRTRHQQQPNNVMPPCLHLHWPWPARAPSNWLAGWPAGRGSHAHQLLAASTGRPAKAICKLHSSQIYIYLQMQIRFACQWRAVFVRFLGSSPYLFFFLSFLLSSGLQVVAW